MWCGTTVRLQIHKTVNKPQKAPLHILYLTGYSQLEVLFQALAFDGYADHFCFLDATGIDVHFGEVVLPIGSLRRRGRYCEPAVGRFGHLGRPFCRQGALRIVEVRLKVLRVTRHLHQVQRCDCGQTAHKII